MTAIIEGGVKPSEVDPSLPDNAAEADAAKDAADEEQKTGEVNMDKPDWAEDIPDPKK
jgi:hypothetical protein